MLVAGARADHVPTMCPPCAHPMPARRAGARAGGARGEQGGASDAHHHCRSHRRLLAVRPIEPPGGSGTDTVSKWDICEH